ncbi:MAG TPA: TIM barrel protein [Terriglobia bacterium]|nr:TIM barrel protein [Terriglobia bacterium]
MMKRREFLARCSAAAGLAAVTGGAPVAATATSSSAPQFYNTAKLFRVGVSSWSFRNYFTSTRAPGFDAPGPLITLLDFPQIVADRYQIHRLEFAAAHFASRESAYLVQLRRQIERAHSRVVNIDVPAETETGGGLSGRDPAARHAAIAAVKQWIDAARSLGAIAVSAGPGAVNPADLSPTLDSYRELAAYGRLRRVDVLIENHAGLDSGNIVDILREVSGRGTGALPDFAQFPDSAARDAGLEILFPRASVLCHASGVSFDAGGNETTFNFKNCVEMAKRFHFRGIYSVVYEGTGDPYQGVQHVVNELIRFV